MTNNIGNWTSAQQKTILSIKVKMAAGRLQVAYRLTKEAIASIEDNLPFQAKLHYYLCLIEAKTRPAEDTVQLVNDYRLLFKKDVRGYHRFSKILAKALIEQSKLVEASDLISHARRQSFSPKTISHFEFLQKQIRDQIIQYTAQGYTRTTTPALSQYTQRLLGPYSIDQVIMFFDRLKRQKLPIISYTLLKEMYRHQYAAKCLSGITLTRTEIDVLHSLKLPTFKKVVELVNLMPSDLNGIPAHHIRHITLMHQANRARLQPYQSASFPPSPEAPLDSIISTHQPSEEILRLLQQLPDSFWKLYCQYEQLRPTNSELSDFVSFFSKRFTWGEGLLVLNYLEKATSHSGIYSLLFERYIERGMRELFHDIALTHREMAHLWEIDDSAWAHLEDDDSQAFSQSWHTLPPQVRLEFRQLFHANRPLSTANLTSLLHQPDLETAD